MRAGLGYALMAMGGCALVAAFAVHADDNWAMSCAAVGVALFMIGGAARGSSSAVGRTWVGYAALLVFIPPLFALLLLAWMHWGTQFPLHVESEVWLVLGLATSCGAALALLSVERAASPADRHERVVVDLAIGIGSLDLAGVRSPRRGAHAAAFAVSVLLYPCVAVLYGGLPVAQAVPLVGVGWAIQNATLILHELGHAMCGLALGYRVRRVTIGGAPLLASFNIGSARVELGLLPSHGFVEFDFGAVPVWVGLRRVAWAGPATGLLPFGVGIVGSLACVDSPFAFSVFLFLALFGFTSFGQLMPERIRIENRLIYGDGVWLFFPEPIRKHTLTVSDLIRLRLRMPVLATAQLMTPDFIGLYQRLDAEPAAQQRRTVLEALARTTPDGSAVDESPMCELFLFGCLLRLSRALGDTTGLEPTMDRISSSNVSPLFKARALDTLACSLVFPPVHAQLAFAERSARLALDLFPTDPTLHGTLGAALVELGKTAEARNHLLYLLKHSLQRSDRRLAREYLKRCPA